MLDDLLDVAFTQVSLGFTTGNQHLITFDALLRPSYFLAVVGLTRVNINSL